MNKSTPLLPFRTAFWWILLSTLLISGSTACAVLYYRHLSHIEKHDPAYHISILVQSSAGRERLTTAYLAELLDLSTDRPTNLFSYDAKEGEKKLRECPIIKEAAIVKIR